MWDSSCVWNTAKIINTMYNLLYVYSISLYIIQYRTSLISNLYLLRLLGCDRNIEKVGLSENKEKYRFIIPMWVNNELCNLLYVNC